jgi:hypothetical protein
MDDVLWKTREGEVLKLSEMEDTHIINSMAMIRRKVSKIYMMDTKAFKNAGVKASDLLPKIFWSMVEELRRRNCEVPELDARILEL